MRPRRWARGRLGFGRGMLMAVVAPLGAIGLYFGAGMLNAYGPPWLDNWAGGLLRLAMTLVAMGLIVFTSLYFEGVVVFLGSFLALGIALFAAGEVADAWVLDQRGRTTPCAIVDIDSRVEQYTTTDANGNTTWHTRTLYDHRLNCVVRDIGAMTTGAAAGKVGERIMVAYDPDHRVGVRPAEGAFDYAGPLWTCCVGAAVGIGLRLFQVIRYR
ncbi:hypothetical protein AB0B45_26300 [Nonomuraea sp. NPDC049152]|uniref:hypothetical protein n=1 Tax=Nonomuraea sp. NPDC049152 TaxID=3154350 RepID=UPI0033E643D0